MGGEEKEAKEIKRRRRFRQGIGIMIGSSTAGFLAFGSGILAGAAPIDISAVIAFCVGIPVIFFILRRQGWTFWLILTLAGYMIGIVNALQLLGFREEVEGAYAISLVTALVFTALGFILGMVAEFIRFLHTLTHGIRNDKADDGNEHGSWSATTTN